MLIISQIRTFRNVGTVQRTLLCKMSERKGNYGNICETDHLIGDKLRNSGLLTVLMEGEIDGKNCVVTKILEYVDEID